MCVYIYTQEDVPNPRTVTNDRYYQAVAVLIAGSTTHIHTHIFHQSIEKPTGSFNALNALEKHTATGVIYLVIIPTAQSERTDRQFMVM